jgi:hypothetical protein
MNAVSVNARIYSARIFVITFDWCVNASRVRIARISGARVVVIARNCNVFASSCLVARIGGTCIAVITILWGALALAVYATLNGTCIFVIATKDVLTLSIDTFIDGTSVVIIAIDWCADTSFSLDTSINSARISIVTTAIVWSIGASTVRIASIYSASNTIITVLWGVDDSFGCITSLDGAKIRILARKWSVDTFSRSGITLISCACISVVTDNRGVSATSWCASINGTFVVITASVIVWGECALSVLWVASINSTADTIITDFVGAWICVSVRSGC